MRPGMCRWVCVAGAALRLAPSQRASLVLHRPDVSRDPHLRRSLQLQRPRITACRCGSSPLCCTEAFSPAPSFRLTTATGPWLTTIADLTVLVRPAQNGSRRSWSPTTSAQPFLHPTPNHPTLPPLASHPNAEATLSS